jgi:hypothetical protein
LVAATTIFFFGFGSKILSKCDFVFFWATTPIKTNFELFMKRIAKKAGITIFICFYRPTYPIAI